MKKYAIYSTDSQSFLNNDGNFGNWNQTPDEIKEFDSKEEAETYREDQKLFNPNISINEMHYTIQDREAGNIIGNFDSYKEAKEGFDIFEANDKVNGEYVEDFYQIVAGS